MSKDIGTRNLLEYYDGPIPTKYDKATQKETPITLIPRSIISYVNKNDSNDRPGKVFRDHINSVWLPEGLEIRIYPAKDINGKTALIWACEYGTPKIVLLLIEKGSNVNEKDIADYTPLISACNSINEQLEIVKI